MALQQSMKKWWKEYPRVPEYFNRIKYRQKKAARASLPIMEKWLTAIATSYILDENSFMTAQDKWDELISAEKTWEKWRNHFVYTQSTI